MSSTFLTGGAGQGTDQPGSPALQSIPEPDGTMQGVMDTLNALVQNVRHLSGQNPGSNNTQPPGPVGNSQKPKDSSARFKELSRETKDVTVTDKTSGAKLVYTQITKLVMQDTVTKEQWTWTL